MPTFWGIAASVLIFFHSSALVSVITGHGFLYSTLMPLRPCAEKCRDAKEGTKGSEAEADRLPCCPRSQLSESITLPPVFCTPQRTAASTGERPTIYHARGRGLETTSQLSTFCSPWRGVGWRQSWPRGKPRRGAGQKAARIRLPFGACIRLSVTSAISHSISVIAWHNF